MGALGIDEKVSGKRAAAEQHRTLHLGPIRQADEDGPAESPCEHGAGLDKDALTSDAGGAADTGDARDGGVAGDLDAEVIGGGEINEFFIGRERDILGVDA